MAPSPMPQLDPSKLKAFSNAAAGHDGVLCDPSGELLIKPCVDAEIDFYQETLAKYPDFAELMPTYMGTLSLGSPQAPSDTPAPELSQQEKDQARLHGVKIASETAIVLENLEHGFKFPNVLDLKLGSVLYDPATTEPEKAARLDRVAQESTSGSLNFRVAGMKVWNPTKRDFDIYDKFYGREFSAENVSEAYETFFAALFSSDIKGDDAVQLLETILAEVTKARHILEKAQSRMYSASVLIVCEGDTAALNSLLGAVGPSAPSGDERAPTAKELKRAEAEEEEDEEAEPVAFKVKMIDFAHAKWTEDGGRDENTIKGLKNVEQLLDGLIGKFD
ncbi:hypothetical protein B0A48_13887 [Cryoendolithus antarcticus]|uniref:Kinase n=1 Tax=Cryoendolithus antarcticus TaxID=1507870 RepID=A0A1V8SMJ4_9PEZI|nr:hypothetical protein B0A48_13887 [Cryoendolithus antarcticus]